MTQTRIYLDYAATAPLLPEALAAMMPLLAGAPQNASSLHFEGRRARAVLDEARERIAACLGAKRREIVFCASGSEADTLAIFGTARLRPGRHIVSCAVEHHAVLRALESLESAGYDVTLLPVDRAGVVDPQRFESALRPETALASVMYANNEIGSIEPIAELAAIAHRRGVPFHSDAVQAPGWLPIDVDALPVDLMSLSAHKFGGPAGVGVLYVRDGSAIAPIVYGGGQEAGRRAGTEHLAGVMGAAVALELAEARRTQNGPRVATMRDRLEQHLLATIARSRVNGAGAVRLPNLTNLAFSGVTAEAMAVRLDLEGIAISPGAACTSGVAEPSHVVAALRDGDPREAVRFSLGPTTTSDEIERTLQIVPAAVAELRRGE